jgi:hypothetical protein
MDPLWPFHYLPMHVSWPLSDTVLARDTPKHGIIQLCLLHTKLFQEAADDTVREIRYDKPYRCFPCRTRPLLVQELAQAFWAYDTSLEDSAQDLALAKMEADGLTGQRWIEDEIVRYRFTGKYKRHLKRLEALHKEFTACREQAISRNRDVWMPNFARHYRSELLKACYSAFEQHGPGIGYPRVSLCAALFHILASFRLVTLTTIDANARRIYDVLQAMGKFKRK